ncbi:hypothetical protein GE09DRAFT_592488 [Coniochaeta sp. 2T2.1]|nr:hypothetical protein GE09DRAFT_592488 [Coniochaeta sp. 2T2.1]
MAAFTLSSLPATRRLTGVAVASLVFASFLSYIFLSSSRYNYPTFPFSSVSDAACDDIDSTINKAAGKSAQHGIPNIVHYVWLLKDHTEFRLSFRVFISIYSAHLFWQPETIFIHTDANPDVYREAQIFGDVWTRRILALPAITPHFVQAPNVTEKGVKIVRLEHKADFVRMSALREYGGVYLDTDAVPLRDIGSLQNSGFANVLGLQTGLSMRFSGYLNNGVMMSVKQSSLMELYYHAAQQFFDGRWATASVDLLTDLATRLVSIPSEVLILEPRAFSPMSWQFEDQNRLFKPSSTELVGHLLSSSTTPDTTTCRDALAWLRQRELAERDSQEVDFSSSYVLHAFDNSLDKIWGWDHVIDVKYVLERRSIYARAVFPAVWHAVQGGIIPQDEID